MQFNNSNLKDNFNNFKDDLIEDFDTLKKIIFAEVKSFKDKLLDSFQNVMPNIIICYSYKKAIHHRCHHQCPYHLHHQHDCYHYLFHCCHHHCHHHQMQIFYQHQKKKVLQKNIIQNTVSKEHGRVYEGSNASNSTKCNDYKKDQDRKNELVAIIGDSMIKHLNN